MASELLSALRAQDFRNHYVQFGRWYSAHRPLVQRAINITFIVYVLGSTFRGLSGKGGSSRSNKSRKGKGSKGGKDDDDKKSTRVAVRWAVGFHIMYQLILQ